MEGRTQSSFAWFGRRRWKCKTKQWSQEWRWCSLAEGRLFLFITVSQSLNSSLGTCGLSQHKPGHSCKDVCKSNSGLRPTYVPVSYPHPRTWFRIQKYLEFLELLRQSVPKIPNHSPKKLASISTRRIKNGAQRTKARRKKNLVLWIMFARALVWPRRSRNLIQILLPFGHLFAKSMCAVALKHCRQGPSLLICQVLSLLFNNYPLDWLDGPGVADANAARNNIAKDYMKKCNCIWILAPITRAVDDKTARGVLNI